jgi:pilus assembly protein Flp/PilA
MKEPVITLPGSAAPVRLRFKPWSKFWMQILADDAGQDLIEYALLAALVGMGGVLSMKGLSNKISNTFNNIGTTLAAS